MQYSGSSSSSSFFRSSLFLVVVGRVAKRGTRIFTVTKRQSLSERTTAATVITSPNKIFLPLHYSLSPLLVVVVVVVVVVCTDPPTRSIVTVKRSGHRQTITKQINSSVRTDRTDRHFVFCLDPITKQNKKQNKTSARHKHTITHTKKRCVCQRWY